jgi:hypothetical protein
MVFNIRIVSAPVTVITELLTYLFMLSTGSRQRPFLARHRPGVGPNRPRMQQHRNY